MVVWLSLGYTEIKTKTSVHKTFIKNIGTIIRQDLKLFMAQSLRKHAHVIYNFSIVVKIEIFLQKMFDIFLIFAQNIDRGYTLEPPRRGGSNEYPQSMFWSKNKKNRYTPAYPSFAI